MSRLNLFFKKQNIFSYFLFSYFLFLVIFHWEFFLKFQNLGLLILGFIFAVFAHTRKNIFVLLFILIHIFLEWFEWSSLKFIGKEFYFNIIHIVLDVIFLRHEIKVHINKKFYFSLYLFIIFMILLISGIGFYFGSKIDSKILYRLEPFVLGGILGCLASHFYFHFKKCK